MGIQYLGSGAAVRAVIDSPGVYTIDGDMTSNYQSTAAIYVQPGTPYVTIKLRSRIVGAAGSGGLSAGIQADGCPQFSLIGEGGSIEGFYFGVRASGIKATVKDIAILSGWFRGITIDGDDGIVRGCDVRNITGTTSAPTARTCGIEISGARPKLLGNYVENIVGVYEEAIGLSVTDRGIGGMVFDNIAKNPNLAPSLPNGNSAGYGLWVGGASDVASTHNHFERWGVGIAYSSPPAGMVNFNSFRDCPVPMMIGDPTRVAVGAFNG
jgi:hypothetical protein